MCTKFEGGFTDETGWLIIMDHSNFMEMVSLIEFMYEQFIQDFLFDFRLVQAYITGGVEKGDWGYCVSGARACFWGPEPSCMFFDKKMQRKSSSMIICQSFYDAKTSQL